MFFWKKSEGVGGEGGWGGDGGSFLMQKITLQIFLVSKQYMLIINIGKNVKKWGMGAGVNLQSKQFHCKFTHIDIFWQKSTTKFPKIDWGGGGRGLPFHTPELNVINLEFWRINVLWWWVGGWSKTLPRLVEKKRIEKKRALI